MRPTSYDHARPWARQPCDTDRGWSLFSDYLAEGPRRSVAKFAKKPLPDMTPGQVYDMAHDCAWRERAREWDLHLANGRQEACEQIIREDARAMAARHLRMSRDLADLGHAEIRRIARMAEKTDMPQVPANVARRMIIDAIKADRLVAGQATEIIATPDVSALSVEELRALRTLQERAGVVT